MKKITLTIAAALAFALCGFVGNAQITWDWSDNGTGAAAADDGYDICTDALGNSYVTGGFSSASITFGTTTITGGGKFIVKYDNTGTVQWAVSTPAGGNGICTDGSNVYVIGSYSAYTITVGSTTLSNVTSSGTNRSDICVAAFDNATGNPLWAKSYGGTYNDYGYKISTDGSNVWLAGYFTSPICTFSGTTVTNAGASGSYDICVAKINTAGTMQWARAYGGTKWDYAYDISNDASGNAYVTGKFQSTSISFGTNTLAGPSCCYYWFYVTKLNSAGTAQWATGTSTPGGGGDVVGIGISTDAAGNSYVTGYLTGGSATFGAYTVTETATDAYAAKFNNAGTPQWATSWGGTSQDIAEGITTDAAGVNVYATGYFISGAFTFGSQTITGTGDMFVVKLAGSDGSQLCAESSQGPNLGGEYGWGISTYDGINVSTTGFFEYNTTFGSLPTLTSGGNHDAFIAHFTASGSSCAILPVTVLSFTGHNKGDKNILEWITATETNNDYFDIERSADGNNFEAIGKTQGTGNSAVQQSYSFTDEHPAARVNYYRLKQIDYDGKFTYSNTVSVTMDQFNNLTTSIYPNPANTILNYELFSKGEGTVNVQVIDVLGTVSMKEDLKTIKGMNTQKLNVSNLAPGIYFLKIINGTEQSQIRFVKQ